MRGLWEWIVRKATKLLILYWARREKVEVPGRHYSEALGDNVQQTMNLIMPLKHPGPETTAELLELLQFRVDDLFSGLDMVGTVHFARFDVIDGNLSMISVYDGDFETYIRDFIAAFGDIFDAIMAFVKDPPPVPTGDHPSAFVAWVNARDLMQLPEDATRLTDDLSILSRRLLLLFNAKPQVQLGVYRSYPGYSVAQIRQALGLEWVRTEHSR
ncbi:MAG: hypothetical protein AAGD35_07910 [Actinomycetota bacterium]